ACPNAETNHFERDDAIEAFLMSAIDNALTAPANLLEQFVIAKVKQHRHWSADVIDASYNFVGAETGLEQACAAGLFRGIGGNRCSAFATQFHRCDSHRAGIPFFQILHGNSPKVTTATRR